MKAFRYIVLLLLLLACSFACAEDSTARDITAECRIKLCATNRKASNMTDGKYTSYWESKETKEPFVTLTSEEPIYGLYLCFRTMPESYEITDGNGKKLAEGDTRFYHAFYELNGVHTVTVRSTQAGKHVMGFNEIYAFGEGTVPEWVQRWEPAPEKADIMFLMAHPDDELIFLGGAIPTYAVEREKNVLVAYLTYSNTTRRSEALNGLWSMGVRNYPVFGSFRDAYAGSAEDGYKNVSANKKTGQEKVWKWVTGLFRQYCPEVVVTHDINGEYGHGQHKMTADAVIHCYDLAADPSMWPELSPENGAWQVRKLYVHLYGDESNQTTFDWNIPLEKAGGKTGIELASDAYACHVTQKGASIKIRGKKQYLSVEETGTTFPNTVFGLYRTEVGEDTAHDDFLENISE